MQDRLSRSVSVGAKCSTQRTQACRHWPAIVSGVIIPSYMLMHDNKAVKAPNHIHS